MALVHNVHIQSGDHLYIYVRTVAAVDISANCNLKTSILSWLQNDGSREFSVDQLKGKQLSPTFQPDALVVFRAK